MPAEHTDKSELNELSGRLRIHSAQYAWGRVP